MLSAPPVPSRSSVAPLLPTHHGEGRSRPCYHCGYYDRDGPTKSHCHKEHDRRNKENSSSPGTRTSTLTPYMEALTK
jgi:hypothetical protein